MELIAPGVKHFVDRLFCLSLDVGQQQDHSAYAVIELQLHSHVTVKGMVLKKWRKLYVRELGRIPLSTDYVQQVEFMHSLYLRPPLNGTCGFVLDDTGVGKPVGDMFLAFGMNPLRVSITAGDDQSPKGNNRWSVSKAYLISILDAALHSRELLIASALSEASVLKEELRNFQRSVSAAGRFTYSARVGKHDDLILAVALGLWNFVGRKKPPTAIITRAHYVK